MCAEYSSMRLRAALVGRARALFIVDAQLMAASKTDTQSSFYLSIYTTYLIR